MLLPEEEANRRRWIMLLLCALGMVLGLSVLVGGMVALLSRR